MNAPGKIEASKLDTNRWIGRSVERLEDPPLVTGRGR
jgi:hypothetical protein